MAYYNKYLLLKRDTKLRNVKPGTFQKTQDQFHLFNLSFSVQLAAKQNENIIKTCSLEQAMLTILNVDSTTTFKVAAPRIWNILPKDIRKQDNYYTFKKQLKTHYFKLAYNF